MSRALFRNYQTLLLKRTLLGEEDLALGLTKWRFRALAATLERAERDSFHYRRHVRALAEAGSALLKEAEHLESAADGEEKLADILEGLPFTSPEELAENPTHFLAVPHQEVEGLVTVSSGSQGPAKRVFSSRADLENVKSFFQYGMLNLCLAEADEPELDPLALFSLSSAEEKKLIAAKTSGQKVSLLMSGSRPGSVGALLTEALARWSIPCETPGFLPADPSEHDAFVQKTSEARATSIVGLPSQLWHMARSYPRPEGLRNVLLSGESAPKALVRAIEQEWNVDVYVHFGLTEFGLGGAVECQARQGPHLRETDIVAEILDENGSALPPGQIGDIVLTSLSREAMPLIRYRTGDEGMWLEEPCPCGCPFRRLAVIGRKKDKIVLPSGRSLTFYDLAEAMAGQAEVTGFSAAYASRPKPELTIAAHLKKDAAVSAGNLREAEEEAKMMKRLKTSLGDELPLRIILSTPTAGPAPAGAKPVLTRTD
ncbi:MAG: AMP-binding protein [Deltaproteobacteria bacterium]|jgi:phenylacetate-coenzyme A ligase PaaK-like adenylate-forming protein|nr:AMP-binding protein [Deltaproteobacteria bacterium]